MRHVIQTLSQTTMEINVKSISFEKVEWIMPIIQIPIDWLQNEWFTWELLICPCKSHTGYFWHLGKFTPCISVIKQEFNSKTDACYTMISNRIPLLWRHDGGECVSNHQPHNWLLNRIFGRWSKKASKIRVTGLLRGLHWKPVNSTHKWPVTRKMLPFDDVIMNMPCPYVNAPVAVSCVIAKRSYGDEILETKTLNHT